MRVMPISNKAFKSANADRLKFNTKRTLTLALLFLWTNSATNCRQGRRCGYYTVCTLKILIFDARYKMDLDFSKEPYDILCDIGRKRGMVIRGGEIDTERAAVMLMDEYRSAVLGKITLEWPEEVENNA
jgi:hypothetical protein